MKRLFTLSLLIFAFSNFIFGQTIAKKVILVNGGQFGNPSENVNLVSIDPVTGAQQTIDTIQTQSTQDLLIEGIFAYAAAQDSIVKYNLVTGERLAANAFGAPSTISLKVWDNYLLVGNWYAPFGAPGPYRNHFRIFDKNTLAFVDSIPEITEGAKSFVVAGDTAYIAQNRTSSAFADTAGWLVRVNLSTLTYIDSLAVNQNGEDLGNLVVKNGLIYGINSESNTLTVINPVTGAASTQPANANFQAGGYGSRLALDQNGLLHTVISGNIATYNLETRSVINPSVVDTVITAFALDTVGNQYYVTQTDFFSYTQGRIYQASGQRTGQFVTGFSPEVIKIAYNTLPLAVRDTATTRRGDSVKIALLVNDADPDGGTLTASLAGQPLNGLASLRGDTLVYSPDPAFIGIDSVRYVVADAWGDTATAWAVVTVQPALRLARFTDAGVKAWPNPAAQVVFLETMTGWQGDVLLKDLRGQTLAHRQLLAGERLEWPVAGLPAGMYVFEGRSAAGGWMLKWVKL